MSSARTPGIEEGDERHLLVEHRRHALVGGMRAEAPAPFAERAAGFRHRKARNHHRPVLDGDVGEPHHLPRLVAFVQDRLVDDHHDVAGLAVLVVGELRDRHALHRKHRMRAVEGRHRQPRDFRSAQIVRRRLLRSVEQFFTIDDLQKSRPCWCRIRNRRDCLRGRSKSVRAVRSAPRRLRPAPDPAGRNRGFLPGAPDR